MNPEKSHDKSYSFSDRLRNPVLRAILAILPTFWFTVCKAEDKTEDAESLDRIQSHLDNAKKIACELHERIEKICKREGLGCEKDSDLPDVDWEKMCKDKK